MHVAGMSDYDAFLTHDWGTDELGRSNHARVVRLATELRKAGLRPWLDENEMHGGARAPARSAAWLLKLASNVAVVRIFHGQAARVLSGLAKLEGDVASRARALGTSSVPR